MNRNSCPPLPPLMIVLLAVLSCLAVPAPASAGIAISPAYIDVRLDKERPAGEFIITNNGDTEERYRIKSLHFNLTAQGGLDRLPPDENSLAPWIIFNPKEFTLPPRTKRAVRFVITPRGSLRPGEYWAAMELESLNTSTGSGKDAKGRDLRLKLVSTVLVPIFGQAGDIVSKGQITETGLIDHGGKPSAMVHVVNEGNGRLLVTGEFEVLDSQGVSVEKGQVPKAYIFRGNQRVFDIPLQKPLAPGVHTVRARIDSPQLPEPMTHASPSPWPPPAPAAATPTPPATTQPAAAPATTGEPDPRS